MMGDGKIICSFAGIGKSTLAKKRANVVDLESTPFQRDWQTYARVANHMKNNGYTVLVSCHNELRTQLHNDDVEYDVVLPKLESKKLFMKRYAERGNTEAFIKLLDENWVDFCKELPWESALRVSTEFLSDIIPTVDAVEVVRCKECIHSFKLRGSALKKESPYLYYRDDCTMCGCEALMGNIPEAVFDNFYCGYGEKRTNDGD